MCSHSLRASDGAGNAKAPSGTVGGIASQERAKDVVGVCGLAQKVDGASTDCIDRCRDAAESRQHNDAGVGLDLQQPSQ